ncbi:MAG: valine--tRNA ligase [Planctomycetota bacterium]|jgi:valyl-tRNA synthetase
MTTTPAMTELPRSYEPGEHEAAVRERWDAEGVFRAEPGDGEAYCILIPPPNVTAPLHLGHAFNNTLQDVLVRYHRMRGCRTLWMPGTDHAGIATQTVVEKRLLAQGVQRRDMGREAFVAKVQEWKDEYETTITEQLQELGASCDWRRQRFTMDPMCARAVREAFFRLFRDGLIYRGLRLVNWDPVTLTALADDEVEMREVEGTFWYLRYPLVDDAGKDTGEFVTVATTRPETMLGDTAVAVNPHDEARAALVGRTVRLPIVDRLIPVIADDYVVIPDPDSDDAKAQYASGFLKVTPAHDPNDWAIGERHDLDVVNVMAPDASISAEYGWSEANDDWQRPDAQPLLGQDRDEARRRVVAWFEEHGLLEATRPYAHSVGHSYRSHVPVEPYLSPQWYVRVTDDRLVGEAQRAQDHEQYDGAPPPRQHAPGADAEAHDGGLRFFPARYARTYQSWHDGLRDWCISRQLWWGHRIPAWEVPDCDAARAESITAALDELDPDREHIALRPPEAGSRDTVGYLGAHDDEGERLVQAVAERLGFGPLEQDEDVLDTWFSSGLWPLSTMGWPDPEQDPDAVGLLETFNPSSVLCTAREIITLWVSRMVMFNRYFNEGRIPFRHVYIHAMIQDGNGQKMSKSLGNGVDPRDIIHRHGGDGLRFTCAQMATTTQDVRMPVDTVCPHCDEAFHPKEITTPAGYRVAAPRLTCPACKKEMTSPYGQASGTAEPTADAPLARNTSSKFDLGRNFANKVWNATRFALGNLDGSAAGADPQQPLDGLSVTDRWIVNRLHKTLHVVEDAVAEYQFNVYAEAMYDFIWRDFCDWYLEAIKPTVRDDPGQQQVLRTVLNAALRMLHPIAPFVTEALWANVSAAGPAGLDGVTLADAPLLAGGAWPDIACRVHDEESEARFERMQTLTNAIRNLRGERKVPPRRRITLHAPADVAAFIEAGGGVVETLAGLEEVLTRGDDRPADAIPLTFEGQELLLSGLIDAVDIGTERERLSKEIAAIEKALAGFKGKLANEGYLQKAPPHLVQETRDKCAEAEAQLAAARQALEALGS